MHYGGVPVSSYCVVAEFACVQIIFGATVCARRRVVIYCSKYVYQHFFAIKLCQFSDQKIKISSIC